MSELEIQPGLAGVPVAESAISDIDGKHARLEYRGITVEKLARESSFEETAWLLLKGGLPTQRDLANFDNELRHHRRLKYKLTDLIKCLPETGHPMDALQAGVAALGMFYPARAVLLPDGRPNYKSNWESVIRLIAKLPTIVAAFHRMRSGDEAIRPRDDLGHAANFYYMLTENEPSPAIARVLDACLVLHAEHTMNASTFSGRVTGSTLANPYTVISSAIGTLTGPLHGGANEEVLAVLDEIPSVEKVKPWLQSKLTANPKYKIMGFGHRVYKVKDPRATVLQELAENVFAETSKPLKYQIAVELERVAAQPRLRVQQEGRLPQRRFLFRHRLRGPGHPARPVHAHLRHLAGGRLAQSLAGTTGGQQDLPTRPEVRRHARCALCAAGETALTNKEGETTEYTEGHGKRQGTFLSFSVSFRVFRGLAFFSSEEDPMLDADYVYNNLDVVRINCENRNVKAPVDRVPVLYEERKRLIAQKQQVEQRRNEFSKETGKLLGQEKDPAKKEELKQRRSAEGKAIGDQIGPLDAQLKQVEADLDAVLRTIPNMTHPDAPVGKTAGDNKVIKRWGEPRQFDFKPKDHVAIAEALDLVDFEAGASVAGQKFYFLKNEAVLLELALVQYAMQTLIRHGYTPVITPDLARVEVLEGIGFIPRDPNPETRQVYTVADTDLCLVATAEITLGGMHRDQTLNELDLPLKYVGLSHCFRTEAGAPGRDAGGLYRVHQFTKVEMFAFTAPDQSEADPSANCWPSRRKSSRDWACRITSSTPAPATWAGQPIASTTWKPGCRAGARRASTAR